ncbi:MAG: IS982 family transposase [Chloroflexota bacterium]|nr:IS982 family transposase [Chloroflexota bacterium]
MDLESFSIAVYCLIDEGLLDLTHEPAWRPVRQRGPAPLLAASEVLTMEAVGEFLGLAQDVAIVDYFRRYHPDYFPALAAVHRTTFVRQVANLWVVKERLWRVIRDRVLHDPLLSVVDSVPVSVCRYGRSQRCQRFRGEAADGYDQGSKAIFYGFRVHLRPCWPGVLAEVQVAPANASDLAVAPEVVAGADGVVLGDRTDWSPLLRDELHHDGVDLLAPYRHCSEDPQPAFSHDLSRLRWRIETVAAQLVARYHLKRIWARDAWHLTSRILRKVLSPTIAVCLCRAHGLAPLHLAGLLSPP